MSGVTLEICVGSLEQAVAAERAGADRIELCAELAVGGTTSGVELMKAVRAAVRIPVYAMVRPRGGNFVYSPEEFAQMRESILVAKECGMDGAVLGILDAAGRVDVARTGELVELARPFPVTFHRALDECADLSVALEGVIKTGALRILTSGGEAVAAEGLAALERLVTRAGERISIMPGAGIDAENVKLVVERTSAREIHASLGLAGLPQSGAHPVDALAEWEQRVSRLRAAMDGIV